MPLNLIDDFSLTTNENSSYMTIDEINNFQQLVIHPLTYT